MLSWKQAELNLQVGVFSREELIGVAKSSGTTSNQGGCTRRRSSAEILHIVQNFSLRDSCCGASLNFSIHFLLIGAEIEPSRPLNSVFYACSDCKKEEIVARISALKLCVIRAKRKLVEAANRGAAKEKPKC
uniref:Uncharacterized protein n=1 Tax=Ananas comosus var. bracteatus TaxID=296719 RepID=A0A6V7Q9L9_ANACO|nr:unnamed protein product [Ananas comosus var. bracteatus]